MRRAFTLIELLVVLALVLVLAALLLPAVQKARLAAKRQRCLSHLRELGVAAHHYHDCKGVLPDAGPDAWYIDGPLTLQLLPWTENNERVHFCPASVAARRAGYTLNAHPRGPCQRPLTWTVNGRGSHATLLAHDTERENHRTGWGLLWCDGHATFHAADTIPEEWYWAR